MANNNANNNIAPNGQGQRPGQPVGPRPVGPQGQPTGPRPMGHPHAPAHPGAHPQYRQNGPQARTPINTRPINMPINMPRPIIPYSQQVTNNYYGYDPRTQHQAPHPGQVPGVPVHDDKKKHGHKLTKAEKKEIRKQERIKRRTESDHFFVQRTGATALIMIMCLLIVAMLGLSVMGIMPQFTALYKEPHYELMKTDDEDGEVALHGKAHGTARLAEGEEEGDDEDGDKDPAVYITAGEFIFGFLADMLKMDLYGDKYNEVMESIEMLDPETDAAEIAQIKEEQLADVQMYYHGNFDRILAPYLEDGGPAMPLGIMLFRYTGAVLILVLLICLITIIKCILSFFGKRLYKRFTLTALILIVCGMVVLLSGLSMVPPGAGATVEDGEGEGESGTAIFAEDNNVVRLYGEEDTVIIAEDNHVVKLGTEEGETTEEEEEVDAGGMGFDFSNLMPFIMDGIVAPADTALALPVVAGFGTLAVLVAPVLMLLFSLFSRRKIYYSVFDR